jgi:hypothetical protein
VPFLNQESVIIGLWQDDRRKQAQGRVEKRIEGLLWSVAETAATECWTFKFLFSFWFCVTDP